MRAETDRERERESAGTDRERKRKRERERETMKDLELERERNSTEFSRIAQFYQSGPRARRHSRGLRDPEEDARIREEEA